MNYKLNWAIQDGKLDYNTGRIIVFEGKAIKSNGPSMDHNDLIFAFARKFGYTRNDIASKVYRFYWKPLAKGLINISPVRRIDEDWACDNIEKFDIIVDSVFGR
jgi:hypothetical protein